MISSRHYSNFTDEDSPPPTSQGSFFQHSRTQTLVIQQGSGQHPDDVAPVRSTVVVQYGIRRFQPRGKSYVTVGAVLLAVGVVLIFCGIIFLAGVFNSSREETIRYDDDAWDREFQSERKKQFDSARTLMVGLPLLGFGAMSLVMGLRIFIPACRHQMKQEENRQRQQCMSTENQLSTGYLSAQPQPRSHQPNQQQYESSYPQTSAFPHQTRQSYPSNQPGSAIPPSMAPPPYAWATAAPYPSAGFTPCGNPELGYTNPNYMT